MIHHHDAGTIAATATPTLVAYLTPVQERLLSGLGTLVVSILSGLAVSFLGNVLQRHMSARAALDAALSEAEKIAVTQGQVLAEEAVETMLHPKMPHATPDVSGPPASPPKA